MLYLYNKRDKFLTPCKETEFKSQNLLERQNLAKWIELNPSILGEELMIVTTEYDRFDKTNERLDLLSIDKEGNLVIIELKRDDSGKNVDLQAIKYAAYCSTLSLFDLIEMYIRYQNQKNIVLSQEEARKAILNFIDNDDFEEFNDRPRIILVAKEFRPEVTASVLWLRKFAIDITCVKWDPYELSDGQMAINSSVLIPLPEARDFVIQAERKEIVEHSKTPTQIEYMQFYLQCIESLKVKLPREYVTPTGKPYYQISTGLSGVHFEWGFHGRPRSSFGVELHFEKGNKEANLKLFSSCAQFKDRIEAMVSESLTLQKDWSKTWARLYVEKQQGKINDELKDWAVEKMYMLIQLLQPELDKTKRANN